MGKQIYQGAIFDLDGVLVDTAKYHFLAWQALAEELEIPFSEHDNERLKGVSRMASLEILLSLGNNPTYSASEKEAFAALKNERYVAYISEMDASEILTGVKPTLENLREQGIRIALGSASKNAPLILERTGLLRYFDELVDGNDVAKAKPDPEVFLRGAEKMGLPPETCVVFEDSEAGCSAAKAAGMYAVGIGKAANLPSADEHLASLEAFRWKEI